MDCKVDRKDSILHIHNLYLETSLKEIEAFIEAFSKELQYFLAFNNCSSIELHKPLQNHFQDKFSVLCHAFLLANILCH